MLVVTVPRGRYSKTYRCTSIQRDVRGDLVLTEATTEGGTPLGIVVVYNPLNVTAYTEEAPCSS